MTDEQIIKALEICTDEHMGCEDGCPYRLGECLDDGYRSKPMKDALDLINRKDAVIFNLNKENSALKLKNDEFLKSNEKAKAEIDRLRYILVNFMGEIFDWGNKNGVDTRIFAQTAILGKEKDGAVKQIKSEAYREFADKLAGAFNKDINLYGRCTLSAVALKINTTLKELTDQTATNQSVSLIDGHIEE